MKFLNTVLIACLVGCLGSFAHSQASRQWKMHDMSRPHPPVVRVPPLSAPLLPPADAVILFDGKNLSGWTGGNGAPAEWTVRDGYFATAAGKGSIQTKDSFGDVQLHIEWATPAQVKGNGQGRGNSGVFLMGLYEVQVLDSYQNDTYADGQAASIYGQYPPLYNASRPPGEWQSYDIFFRRPRFDGAGRVVRPARMTVVHNGVLVQDNVELLGPTSWLHNAPYKSHPDRLPISLQDHSNPVRFRNVWARHLAPEPEPVMRAPAASPISIGPEILDRYTGIYKSKDNFTVVVKREGERIMAIVGAEPIVLEARSAEEFPFVAVDGGLRFTMDEKGMPTGCTVTITGDETPLKRTTEEVSAGGSTAKPERDIIRTSAGAVEITFIGHGTLMLRWNDRTVHVDPYSKVADYQSLPKADVILVTHHHGDHLDKAAIEKIRTKDTRVIMTAACAGQIEGSVMKNGDTQSVMGMSIEAVPAYNLVHKRQDGSPFHPKGEGNGYVITIGGTRIYVAGDTENTPEMKALKRIDVAFLPMNLPYTMTPEMVADAVRAFKPKILYPYHFGETDTSTLLGLLKDMPGVDVRVRNMK